MRRDFLHMACMVLLSLSSHAQDNALSMPGKAFEVVFRDSIPMEVELDFDADSLPDFYHCHVNTPVCSDDSCRVLVLDVYCDLLGNLSGFEVPESRPLTKWATLNLLRKITQITSICRRYWGTKIQYLEP